MNWGVFWAGVGALAALVAAISGAAVYIDKRLQKISAQNELQLQQNEEQARKQAEFHEDWYGLPARPGVDAKPGMMERVKNIEGELRTNGGSTMRDVVNATRAATGELRESFDSHLRNHPMQQSTLQPSVRVEVSPTAGPAQPLEA